MPPKMHKLTIDLTGQTFGQLFVLAYAGRRDKQTFWTCKCLACGSVKDYQAGNLRSGQSTRCLKCSYRQRQKKRCKCDRPGFTSWYRIKRSGHVCERWQCFDEFLADMGEPPKGSYGLVRLDPKKPYSPENCIWAAQPGTRFLTHNGQTKPLRQWAEELGLTRQALYVRLEKMSLSEALTTPPMRKPRNSLTRTSSGGHGTRTHNPGQGAPHFQ